MTARRALGVAFALALALTLFFGVQILRHSMGSGALRDTGEAIAGWMTPRYVSHSRDVPREVVARALGVDLGSGAGPASLADLAEQRGVPVAALIADLEAGIAAHRAGER